MNQFEFKFIFSNKNIGLYSSITSNVRKYINTHEKVIVVEDDLVLDKNFLNFMLSNLQYYKDFDNIFQISGHSFLDFWNQDNAILPITTTWGWATWKRAWKFFNLDVESITSSLKDQKFQHLFNLENRFNYAKMLSDRIELKNDSWGIVWWYNVFMNKGLVSYPRYSLVKNIGFDGSGVNYNKRYINFLHKKKFLKNKSFINFDLSKSLDVNSLFEKEYLSQMQKDLNLNFRNIFRLNV